MVRPRRLELPLRLKNSDLNAARLPIPPRPHKVVTYKIPTPLQNEKRALSSFAKFLRIGLATLLQTSLMLMINQQGVRRMVEWRVTSGLTDYDEAVRIMEQRAEDIAAGRADELLWLVEHPPLYTAGTSAKPQDLISADRFPVYKTKRGGQYTYHGPGQRVVYVMLNLNKRGRDVHCFVRQLEKWVIDTLDQFNITGFIRDGRVGVWVERPDKPKTFTNKTAEDKSLPSEYDCANGCRSTVSP